jgi:hypothetical protein
MEQQSKPQKMSVYFPPDLLERVRQHAHLEKRSFNQDVLWLVEYALEAEHATRRTARHQPK